MNSVAKTPSMNSNIVVSKHGTAFITKDHGIFAWSGNGPIAVPVAAVNVISICDNSNHRFFEPDNYENEIILALTAEGNVVCIGSKKFDIPEKYAHKIVIAIICGANHVAAITYDKTLVCWGNNSAGQCDVPADLKNVVFVHCGDSVTMAVTTEGNVVCWGCKYAKKCKVPAEAINIVFVDSGIYHVTALTRDGRVICWGEPHPSYDHSQHIVPEELKLGLPRSDLVISICCGPLNSAALTQQGKVICWGNNRTNQCSTQSIENASAIWCDYYRTYALTFEGNLLGTDGCNIVIMDTNVIFASVNKYDCTALTIKTDGTVTDFVDFRNYTNATYDDFPEDIVAYTGDVVLL